jgi:decaprenylphospho-beta-D-ribofuranose 2-oxidase
VIVLPADRLEWVEGWGMAVGAAGYVFRPTTIDGVWAAVEAARAHRVPLVPRGAGQSYGDAALAPESVVLDLSRMDRILSWDPATGIIEVEPGVTVRRLWRYALGDGWWPPVVTGTMEPTVGGCLAMNVHGKNHWALGTFGEHCLELQLLLPSGELRMVRPDTDAELFHAVIGSFGQLAIVVGARLQLKRVHSGLLEVRAVSAPDLDTMLRLADEAKDDWEYVVGWIDAFATGRSLGRGLLHFARHLEPGEDTAPAQTLRPDHQDLPDTLLGVVPRSVMWRLLRPFTNRPGMRLINLVKYLSGSTLGDGAGYRQSLAEFSFLLDYVPGWKRIYRPGGMIQHQSFVPTSRASEVFRRQLEAGRRGSQPSFLAVLKRHRPDPFLVGHGVDGFSLALDFPVIQGRRAGLWQLVREMAEPVVEAGGRFYPAKDAALPGELYRSTFRGGELERFAELKAELDPERHLRSALADRLLDGIHPTDDLAVP